MVIEQSNVMLKSFSHDLAMKQICFWVVDNFSHAFFRLCSIVPFPRFQLQKIVDGKVHKIFLEIYFCSDFMELIFSRQNIDLSKLRFFKPCHKSFVRILNQNKRKYKPENVFLANKFSFVKSFCPETVIQLS